MRTSLLKLTLIGLLFLTLSNTASAQYSISTEKRIDAYWSESRGEYVITNEESSSTLFEFNENMTVFTHTTANISSTYYVKNNEFNKEKNRYEMVIVSDVGNTYNMIIDITNRSLRFIYVKNNMTYVVQHNIKTAWKRTVN